jgi:PHP family Zn ribbon phosphoesterase
MNRYLTDLHIHSLLSPCGDLDMSPGAIVDSALKAGLDAIAVCDHNATQQAHAVRLAGERRGLTVFYGAEVTSREEVHCVAILPDRDAAAQLQKWIDAHIIKVDNVPEKFGDQVWVDCDDNIEGEIEWYLNSAVDKSVEEIADEIHGLGGLFIPAHIDRQANSLIGQLGFVSPMLPVDALEYNFPEKLEALKSGGHKYLDKHRCYTASDAHFPHLIGTNPSWLYAEDLSFDELRRAMAGEDGRRIVSRRVES